MLRLRHATRANALAETVDSGAGGLRGLLCAVALAFAALLLAPTAGFANPITDENAQSGTSGWEVTQADAPRIEGYTDKTSVAPDERLGFHVSTNPTASYRINIYRLGWYGGTGARLMTCLPSCSSNGSGSSRSTASANSQTGKIDAGWPESQALTIPSTWTTGEYVAEYVLKSGTQSGFARYSPFVVRSSAPPSSASRILVVVPFNTYLAYNNWGGASSYENNTNKSIFRLAHATKVSFNRPFARREWRFWDYNLVRFLEKEGYDVSYVSDTDVDANPGILQQHRAVIVSGHSEYWSKNMRDGFDAARDAGTNIMFTGANDAYWQVRYEDSSCSSGDTVCTNVGDRRTMVIYKQEASDQVDPITDPALKTIQWRQLGRPECELQGGVQYGGWFPNDGYADYTTTAAGASDPWAAGAGLSQGSTVSGLVGFEFDSFFPNCDVPGTPSILLSYQSAFTSADIDAAAVKYTDDTSGARVFSSGTEQWVWGLDSYRWDPTLFTGIPPTNAAIQQYTRNMLADMTKPAAPVSLAATRSGSTITLHTAGHSDSRVTSYKVYGHSGSGAFQPGDAGVSLVCQNSSGDCTDTQTTGTWRYAVVAVDQWNSSAPSLSAAINVSPPVAANDSATVSEDAPATAVPVLSNDNANGGTLSIASATQPGHGTVVATGGGTGLTYQPAANYCGADSFTYTLNGGDTGTVSITVSCVDDPPDANADSGTVNEDAAATAIGVLANDTDVENDAITIASVDTTGTHGTVQITGGGTGLTYQPNPNYCNTPPGTTKDTFTYTVNGTSAKKTATVSMTVNCVDDPPAANNDSATLTEDAAATAIPVLNNDTDVDGGPITIMGKTNGSHGTVAITGGGSGLTYQPTANYCGADSFTYTLNGGDTANVSITVNCVDDPPVANDDTKTLSEDDSATAINVLANDADVENDPITIITETDGAHGSVAITGGGTGLTYRPNANYCGTDSFTYTVNGGDTATVAITVTCVDDPPLAANDSKTVTEDAAATAVDVLANDTDIDAGPKTVGSVTQPANGTVVNNGSGLTYKPNANYCNTQQGGAADTFTYTLNGGSQATVSMSVTCVDDPPAAIDDSKSVTEDSAATALNPLANDTDIDGGLKEITAFTQPAHGTVTGVGSSGHWTDLKYQPNGNYCGPDSFTYTVNGGDGGTVSVTVTCVDDSPVAVDDSKTVTEGDAATAINVLSNDTDIDAGPKSIQSVDTTGTHGAVQITGGGSGLTYKPDDGYCNNPAWGSPESPDTFTYTLNGGATAKVSVTVDCVPPTAHDDTATTNEGAAPSPVHVLSNDTSLDVRPITIASVDATGAHGTVTPTGGTSGAWTGLSYQPAAGYCNNPGGSPATFTYKLNGGSEATVSVSVGCTPPVAHDDSQAVTENDPATAIDVLGNDNNPGHGPMNVTSADQPAKGTVVITGGGTSLTYKPDAGYCNNPRWASPESPDTFKYTVTSGSAATVSVTVDCIPPTPNDDEFTVHGNTPANRLDILANDKAVDSRPMKIDSQLAHQPGKGTVVVAPDGSGLTYKPDPGACGNDSFEYRLNGGNSATAWITIDCSDPPQAVDDAASVAHGAPATAVPVLANDFDPDGGPMSISSVAQPAQGAVVRNGDGSGLTYQPDAGYCNDGSPTDNFTYTLNGIATASVSITVTCPAVEQTPSQLQDLGLHATSKKCKKGFKRAKGKCRKKKHKRRK